MTRGVSMRALLETLAGMVEQRLDAAPGTPARLVLLPKRVHELGVHEGQAPDGLSAAYVRMAADLNAASIAERKSAPDRLVSGIEQVIAAAAGHERALTALLAATSDTPAPAPGTRR